MSETEQNNEEQQPEGLLATAMQEDVKEEVVDPEENVVPHKVEEDTEVNYDDKGFYNRSLIFSLLHKFR